MKLFVLRTDTNQYLEVSNLSEVPEGTQLYIQRGADYVVYGQTAGQPPATAPAATPPVVPGTPPATDPAAVSEFMRTLEASQRARDTAVLAEVTRQIRASMEVPPENRPPLAPAGTQPGPTPPARVGLSLAPAMADMLRRSNASAVYGGLNRQMRNTHGEAYAQEHMLWRSPMSDGWVAEWVAGLHQHDIERCRVAARMIDSHYRELGRSTPGAAGDLYRAAFVEGTITGNVTGGNASPLIPQPLANLVILARDRFSKIRSLAQIVQMGAGRTIRVPAMGRATAAIFAEGAGAPEGSAVPTEPVMQKRKLGVMFHASDEVVEDTPFNLVTIFSQRAGEAIGAGEDIEFTKTASVLVSASIGQGTAGAAVGGYPDPTPASATALAIGHFYSLYYSLPAQYRGTASWFMGDAMCARASALLDAVGGRPLLQDANAPVNAVGDAPGNEGAIFRRPLFSVPLADGIIVFADASYYGVADAGGITAKVEDLPASDNTKWYFRERTDGQILLAEAIILGNNLNG
jgi:HK97 family phage major capsid protein